MAILNEDMVALRKLCEELQREMPTQIKLIYFRTQLGKR